ncbi:glycosyltransferase [Domibacillus indicus]|uniref:glycosyltransferase family 4 protein n=1 Tax=Domibacillus indicus TaxID=1437523 RepID=UPI0020409B01|nr:glycosyltransferase [Domibacillus indicus]MCM3788887.1 glycosyltransferase [Domibacillus indicus]
MIFFHGHKFINKDGKHYTSGSLNNNVFQRYLDWFEDVTVFANERYATKEDEKFINKKNEVTNIKFNLVNMRKSILNFRNVNKRIKEEVYNHTYIIIRMPSLYGIIAIRYARKFKKKYLVEIVGCPWDAFWNHSLKGKIIAPFMWLMTKYSVKHAPFTNYVTNEFLQKRYPCNGQTIGCSDVELPFLDQNILERRLVKIKNITSNQPIVIGTTAAVDVSYKNQEHVIKAVSKLNDQGFNFEYHLVGGGDTSYLTSVAKKYKITDKVKFLGPLPHREVFDYLDNIDIYIQPSKTEGLPRSLVEAMSRGCPCIGSSAGGIPELINKEFTINNKSVDHLCNLLKKMDKETMLKEAIYSFEKAKEYDKELLGKKRSSFYKTFKKGVAKK